MELFCRLSQKTLKVSASDQIQSGLYSVGASSNSSELLFDVGMNTELSFIEAEEAAAKLLPEKEKKLELIFDGIKDIIKKYDGLPSSVFSHFLPSEIDADIQPNDLDVLIEKSMNTGLFFTIDRSPRMSMRYDVDLLPTSRVRRYASGYQAHLSSHSECWQQRTLTGIIPKKLLAKVSEDDYIIYENVVFARLLDNLQRYLAGLYSKLSQLTSLIDEYSEFEGAEKDFRYRNSITKDWGRAFASQSKKDDLVENSHKLLQKIGRFQGLIMQLKSLGLYQKIPTRRSVGLQLKQTNIFMHDKYYRQLAHLWNNWLTYTSEERLSPSLLNELKLKNGELYTQYVFKTLKYCLHDLGWRQSGPEKSLIHESGLRIEILDRSFGVWDLHLQGHDTIRIVALSELLIDDSVSQGSTLIIAPDSLASSSECVIKISPLVIEGKEILTLRLAKIIWEKVLNVYREDIYTRWPHNVSEILEQTVGFYLSKQQLQEIRGQLNTDRFEELQNKSMFASFIRFCPCCHQKLEDEFVKHSEQKAFKGVCQSIDCNSEWTFDLSAGIKMNLNPAIRNSGRYGFEVSQI